MSAVATSLPPRHDHHMKANDKLFFEGLGGPFLIETNGNLSGNFNLVNFERNGSGMSIEEIENYIRQSSAGSLSNFDELTQVSLIVVFAILIMFGVTGNGLVCYVVAQNHHMRTPRNIFIINLAISDLTLCLFTQPFNLMKASLTRWTLGDFMCKFVPTMSGTNVFVSTISITAIALDRFQVIVYPTKDSMRKVGAAIALTSIWLISLLMASPLLIFNVTKPLEVAGVTMYIVCYENPNLQFEKAAYSIASMIFQYIVPIVMVTIAHARICNKLKYRMINQQPAVTLNSPYQRRKNERETKRKRKTNLLLLMIALVFACSWMPLNAFNIIADFNHLLVRSFDKKGLVVPICHLLVLASACTNPVLYGWLNENFRKEFTKVLCCACCRNIRVICRGRCCQVDTQARESSVVIYTKANNGTLTTYDMDNLPSAVSNVNAH